MNYSLQAKEEKLLARNVQVNTKFTCYKFILPIRTQVIIMKFITKVTAYEDYICRFLTFKSHKLPFYDTLLFIELVIPNKHIFLEKKTRFIFQLRFVPRKLFSLLQFNSRNSCQLGIFNLSHSLVCNWHIYINLQKEDPNV